MAENDVQSRLFKVFFKSDNWVKSLAKNNEENFYIRRKREKSFKNTVLKTFWLEKL